MFNRNIVAQTRASKDSARKREYRMKGNNMARIRLRDLTNGQFRMRLWPIDGEKNPHGYLDYREHNVPLDYLAADPEVQSYQCPRSTNWDPMPGQDGEFRERCVCCEIDASVEEDDGPGTLSLFEVLPEGLKEILAEMDWRASWKSTIALPVTLQAVVHTHTKEEGNNGKTYDNYTYRPGQPGELMSALLQFRQPDFSTRLNDVTGQMERVRNGFSELFFDFLFATPDAGDPITGRWITLNKTNDGKGSGGYSFQPDPYPSSIDPSIIEYKKLYAFPKWGDKTRKKPSLRLSYQQQLDLVLHTGWADDLRAAGVPITDADADLLDAGQPLPPLNVQNVYQQQPMVPGAFGQAPQQPYQQPPNPGFPPTQGFPQQGY